MNAKFLTVSLLALGLFAAAATAQESKDNPAEPPQPATEAPLQPEAPPPEPPAQPEAKAELPAEVMALLGDSRSAAELSVEELQNRYQLARQYARAEGISPDVQQQLQGLAQQARAELMAREQQQAAPQQEQAPAKEVTPAPQPEIAAEPQKQEQPPGQSESTSGGAMPPAVAELLGDGRRASELNDKQLQRRLARIQQFMTIDGLPAEAANRLQAMQADAMEEMSRRQQAQPVPEQQPEQPAPPKPAVADAPAPVPAAPPPAPPKPPVVELPTLQPAPAPPPPVAADKKDVQELDSNRVNAETERRAKELMADEGSIERFSDDELRRRVEALREVLATNELSPGMEREIRQQLNMHRTVLRDRVAAVEADRLRQEQQRNNRKRNRYWAEEAPADWDWAARDVLNDRRRSEDLRTYELRRRLEILRQAAADRRYEPEYREYWRAVIARDQYVLNLRLVDLRRKRQAQLDDLYADDEEFEIGSSVADEDVFAAEVDDERLQDVLIARPRKKFKRRYTIEEIEQSDEVRSALPRVEVDTVRFGFNEAFVRPEEIDKLDRIGEILERILRKNPREVFLIEGHTDAVGSDAANLALSRKRAEAVKKALTTYYVIPPRALRTVGYGERYLKIPTAEAEGENRRVSVSRATDLIGDLQ
jgi:outer membrane protein OmpA-like peptidoglycan-associated protein